MKPALWKEMQRLEKVRATERWPFEVQFRYLKELPPLDFVEGNVSTIIEDHPCEGQGRAAFAGSSGGTDAHIST